MIPLQPFRVERVTHTPCAICGAEAEVTIGRDITIEGDAVTKGDARTPGPLKAIIDCPNCGSTDADPSPFLQPGDR